MTIKRTAILSGGIAAVLSLAAAAGALAEQGTADTGQSLAPSGSSSIAAGYPSPGYRGWDGEFDADLVSYIEPGDRVDLIATVKAAIIGGIGINSFNFRQGSRRGRKNPYCAKKNKRRRL